MHIKTISYGLVFSFFVFIILFVPQAYSQTASHIPYWIKNTAKWWSQGQISDNDFVNSIQYLLQKQILEVPSSQGQPISDNHQIPVWIKNNTGSWATGKIPDDEFVVGLQYLMQNGVLTNSQSSGPLVSNSNTGNTNGITSSTQNVLSDNDLTAIAGDKYSDGNIPLGDGNYVTTGPQKGFIYLCHVPPTGQGASGTGSWIHGSTWNYLSKPSVSGSVSWSNAFFTNVISGESRTLSGNDLPVGSTTGTFPISSSDPVSQYDQNPNSISAQSFTDVLPVHPTYSDTPYCMGGEVGIMLSGVALFDGFDAELRDAPAHEAQDSCNGHPQNTGEYHYHNLSSCFKDISEKTVLGYALDGFPITGPQIAPGKYLTTDDLDECHGITSQINEDGNSIVTYHYVMTYDFPYSASCFRGKPVQYMVIDNGPNQNGPNQGRTPPQEAINACTGKSSGDSCSFTSPFGDMISGTCQMPPSASSLACVPHR